MANEPIARAPRSSDKELLLFHHVHQGGESPYAYATFVRVGGRHQVEGQTAARGADQLAHDGLPEPLIASGGRLVVACDDAEFERAIGGAGGRAVAGGKGDTLSEQVWALLSNRWLRPAFWAFWGWLTWHFLLSR